VPDFIFVDKEEYERDPSDSVYYDYKVITMDENSLYK